METEQEQVQQLFHREFAKMVAVISRLFGLEHIEIAEDIVSETFLLATETWGRKGLPANPTAWLYVVAKRKTISHFRRNKIFETKIIPELTARPATAPDSAEPDFSRENIKDSQLRILFAICTPAIASEAQIGLALRILCGFSIDEIAAAFLTGKDTVNKRLFRAKEKLRAENVMLELPPDDAIGDRLDNVLRILYLLFSEGYYSTTSDQTLRKDLCLEAMRLAVLLTEYEPTNRPRTNALLALMCFHASRFSARQAGPDALVLYDRQNEELWDQELIQQGRLFLYRSAEGDAISSYHLEARIASWHCVKEESPVKWTEILRLYDQLLLVNYSPAVALNRTFALFRANGREAALAEAEKLKLDNNHFYFVLLGELYRGIDPERARLHFQKALALARTQTEKQTIQAKIDATR